MFRGLLVCSVWICSVIFAQAEDWRQFRGPDCRNMISGAVAPLEWSAERNIAWRVEMPGRAVNGVIVVQGRVIATSSSGPEQDRLHVWCVDDATGKVLWKRNFQATGRTATHPLSSIAAPTPASDGQFVYCLFASNDLVCLDLDGNVRWIRALGIEYPSAFDDRGLASSPIVVAGTIIVQIACQGDSLVLGIDAGSGADRWTHALAQTTAWTSPTNVNLDGNAYVLVQSADQLQIIEPTNGRIEWSHRAAGSLIPSPCADGKRVLVAAAGQLACFEVVLGQSEPKTLWQEQRLGPSSGSPISGGDRVFVVRGSNVLNCGSLDDGSTLWQLRLKGSRMWATPLLVGDYLYAVSVEGLVQVVDVRGEKGVLVAENDLEEETLGSPAYANGCLYWRTVGAIVKVATKEG